MASIKIYGRAALLEAARERISDAIHQSVVEALQFPPEKRFHRFMLLADENFIFPDDRSEKYTVIEISMFEGRSVETKKDLIRLLYQNLKEGADIAGVDVEIIIYETPKYNWGIRGLPGDELELNYKVEL